jgi:glyoxylate reductase
MNPVPILVAAEVRSLVAADALTGFEVTWLEASTPLPPGPFEGLVTLLTRRIDRAVLEQLPALRVVANVAVGYDNVDLEAAADRDVIVTNTPEVLTNATAELTWALILAAARGIVDAQQVVRRGAWQGWHPAEFLGLELAGGTLGVAGAGRIGQAVGRRGVAFGMRVVYTARSAKPDFERATGARCLELEALLGASDVVTLHLPASAETAGIISRERLALMRRGAVLVNTARGDLIDEEALAGALRSGHLWAAALDVFRDEPHPSAALRGAPRLVLTPHMGSATERSRRAMAACALANARAVLRGDPPLNPVAR